MPNRLGDPCIAWPHTGFEKPAFATPMSHHYDWAICNLQTRSPPNRPAAAWLVARLLRHDCSASLVPQPDPFFSQVQIVLTAVLRVMGPNLCS